jgi:hypothetical protein
MNELDPAGGLHRKSLLVHDEKRVSPTAAGG